MSFHDCERSPAPQERGWAVSTESRHCSFGLSNGLTFFFQILLNCSPEEGCLIEHFGEDALSEVQLRLRHLPRAGSLARQTWKCKSKHKNYVFSKFYSKFCSNFWIIVGKL